METNPFASPQADGERPFTAEFIESGAWRYGDLLIVGHNAVLPPRCVKCNALTDLPLQRMRLSWFSPKAYFGLLGLFFPFLLIALATQKRITINIAICKQHRNRRRLGITIGVLGGLLAFALVLVAVDARSVLPLLAAAIVFAGSLVACLSLKRTVWPKRIEKGFAKIKGVCPEFLDMLPEAPL